MQDESYEQDEFDQAMACLNPASFGGRKLYPDPKETG